METESLSSILITVTKHRIQFKNTTQVLLPTLLVGTWLSKNLSNYFYENILKTSENPLHHYLYTL